MSRTRDREHRILAAAARLFGSRGPGSVTMDQVARRAGVAKGTLYVYFPSKDDLVEHLVRSHLDALHAGLTAEADAPGSAGLRLRRAVEFLVRAQAASPDGFRSLRRAECEARPPRAIRQGRERLRAALRTLLADAGGDDRTPAVDADLVLGTIDAAVRRCIEGDSTPDTECRAVWAMVRRAVGASPLAGRTILVTRDEAADGPLSAALTQQGAAVLRVPLLETLPPEDPRELRAEAARLAEYEWVVLTSARAVQALRDAATNGVTPRVAAVGEATARAAAAAGWPPALVGTEGAEALVAALSGAGPLGGRPVLVPAADRVRPEGIAALERAGAAVRVVTAYRTAARPHAAEELRQALRRNPVDAVIFTSPSAVEAWRDALGEAAPAPPVVAVIGRTTAAACRAAGLPDPVMPPSPTFEAIAEVLANLFDRGDH